MPQPPISDEVRLRIAELASDGLSVRAIAAELKIAPSTVTRAAQRMGIRFDRSATIAATEARWADARAKRAEAGMRAIEEAIAELVRLRQPMRIAGIAGGNNAGVFHATLPRPTGAERLNIARTFRTYIDAHLKLAAVDQTGADVDHANSVLGALQRQLDHLCEVDAWVEAMAPTGDLETNTEARP